MEQSSLYQFLKLNSGQGPKWGETAVKRILYRTSTIETKGKKEKGTKLGNLRNQTTISVNIIWKQQKMKLYEVGNTTPPPAIATGGGRWGGGQQWAE